MNTYVNPHGKKCKCDFCFDNGFGAIQYIWEDQSIYTLLTSECTI